MNAENIIRFLTELQQNNHREWFNENKNWYQQVRTDVEQITNSLITKIAAFDEDIATVTPKECLFRIYRDIRFSHDKTPYKTHMGTYIASHGGRKSPRGGYYLHLQPEASFISVGVWCPEPNVLKALRKSVYDNIDELNEIRTSPDFARYFNTFFEQDKLKNVPREFPKDFRDAELLKLKHYLVDYKLSNSELSSGTFVDDIVDIFKTAYPLNRFLNYTVDEVLNFD